MRGTEKDACGHRIVEAEPHPAFDCAGSKGAQQLDDEPTSALQEARRSEYCQHSTRPRRTRGASANTPCRTFGTLAPTLAAAPHKEQPPRSNPDVWFQRLRRSIPLELDSHRNEQDSSDGRRDEHQREDQHARQSARGFLRTLVAALDDMGDGLSHFLDHRRDRPNGFDSSVAILVNDHKGHWPDATARASAHARPLGVGHLVIFALAASTTEPEANGDQRHDGVAAHLEGLSDDGLGP